MRYLWNELTSQSVPWEDLKMVYKKQGQMFKIQKDVNLAATDPTIG